MRTTLSIDEDILQIAKERARREGRTTGQVISDLARSALTAPPAPLQLTERNGLPVLPSRGTTVTNDLIDQLREEEGV